MNEKKFNDYNTFLRNKFGVKVYKISLDAGFTCPNIDGNIGVGGCIYCNNKSFSPAARQGLKTLDEQISAGMEIGKKMKAKKFIAYFQANTNTYSSVENLKKIYEKPLEYPDIVGISIGTRPDCVNEEKIALLESLAKKTFVSIEYGVQTANNETLKYINRGHTFEAFLEAVKITKNRNIHICAHVMLGFPGETRSEMLDMANKMNKSGIDSIKIHNLIITKDTELENIYIKKPFHVFDYEEYIELVCEFLEILSPLIVIERVCASAPSEYVIAPDWTKSPAKITDDITEMLKSRESYQGKIFYMNSFI